MHTNKHTCTHKLHTHMHSPLQASASLAPFTLQVTCVCTYKIQVCISLLTSISHTNRHIQTWRPHTHRSYHTTPYMLPQTPMAPCPLPPSLPHSPKRRELVKDARRQHADRVAVQVELPGHETRRQSALTLSTSTCPLRLSVIHVHTYMQKHTNAKTNTVTATHMGITLTYTHKHTHSHTYRYIHT